MSRIYFHAEDGEAEVRGSERAYASCWCDDLFLAALGLTGYVAKERLTQYRELVPAEHWLHKTEATNQNVALAFSGREFFTEALNTAYVIGSEPVRLLARLHGQCEIHAYVEGPHRAWLAGIIERGRETKVLRADMGWESVIALLRSSDRGPVVTSYSVCEQFPNRAVSGWVGDPDAWYDLPDEERWRRAIEGLYANGDGLQITPERWDDFYFGDGTTAFDLLDQMQTRAAARQTTEGHEHG